MKKIIRSYFEITLGAVLLALGLQFFHVPHNLVAGGVTGIAIIIEYVTRFFLPFHIPIWVTNIAINLPMLLLSYRMLGKSVFTKSLYTILMMTITLAIAENMMPAIYPDLFLSAVFGGVVLGVATALMLRQGATSGGTTLMAAIIQRYLGLKHIKLTTIILTLDVSIIITAMIVFDVNITMYAIISIFIIIKVTDVVIQGFSNSKAVYIVSKEMNAVVQGLMENVPRGITIIHAEGAYTREKRDMIMCVMSQRQMVTAKEVVREIDKEAFVIVSAVTEVLGNGFSPLFKEDTLV